MANPRTDVEVSTETFPVVVSEITGKNGLPSGRASVPRRAPRPMDGKCPERRLRAAAAGVLVGGYRLVITPAG